MPHVVAVSCQGKVESLGNIEQFTFEMKQWAYCLWEWESRSCYVAEQYSHFHKLARKYFNIHNIYSETIFNILIVFAVVIAFPTVSGNAQLFLDKSLTHIKWYIPWMCCKSDWISVWLSKCMIIVLAF